MYPPVLLTHSTLSALLATSRFLLVIMAHSAQMGDKMWEYYGAMDMEHERMKGKPHTKREKKLGKERVLRNGYWALITTDLGFDSTKWIYLRLVYNEYLDVMEWCFSNVKERKNNERMMFEMGEGSNKGADLYDDMIRVLKEERSYKRREMQAFQNCHMGVKLLIKIKDTKAAGKGDFAAVKRRIKPRVNPNKGMLKLKKGMLKVLINQVKMMSMFSSAQAML
ncbi:hypothetical protein QVD17_20430 [Tagetes erecta]|uniref:Uncharacterized protein n=1 Tax=Tagetes erecta TaxID=13708 RepID=A0AAD8NY60_TARER|nr:hypothetical protein QVD17_20430 [Tagetes erecta]